MRQKITKEKLERFMTELARRTSGRGTIYFTGGSTALLLGIRDQTIDIDIKVDPEPRGLFEAIAGLKNELDINIELAAPDDFIPTPSDWRNLAVPITTIGGLSFSHYDFVMQALAKIERGFAKDIDDVTALVRRGFVSVDDIRKRFRDIEPNVLRYPGIDSNSFSLKVEAFIQSLNLPSSKMEDKSDLS
jgi:hypothetical protein